MKKTLLSIICILACTSAIIAQTLYGITVNGGSFDSGTINRFIPPGNLTVQKSFTSSPQAVNPSGTPVQASNGKLYGLTIKGGTTGLGGLYSFDPVTSAFTTLLTFNGANGANPPGSLIQANNGKLYGMSPGGGTFGGGLIFSFDPTTSAYAKLVDFDGDNGANPYGSLLQAKNGKLYGMTKNGGPIGSFGVIFSFDPVTSIYTRLIDFASISRSGEAPYGSLIQASNGKLYGMTSKGGTSYVSSDGVTGGIFFSFDPVTSQLTLLKNLGLADGYSPFGSLVEASNGKLYGLTYKGGSTDLGVIFSYDPYTSTFTRLKTFNGSDGAHPYGNLLQASDGKLYGETSDGGSNNLGVVFSFDPVTSVYTKLVDYNRTNGANPYYGSGFIEIGAPPCIKKTFFLDADGDGYGNINCKVQACSRPPGYSDNSYDCNDKDKNVHYSMKYYRDADCDGYGDNNTFISVCLSSPPAGYVKNNYDCDDRKKAVMACDETVRMCRAGISKCFFVKDINANLCKGWSLGPCAVSTVSSRTVTGKMENTTLSAADQLTPAEYKLSNYPNPFAGKSTIRYELPFDSKVSIKVYDVLGRVITTLVNEDKKAGTYTVEFNAGRSGKGSLYYRIIATSKTERFEATNKMILLE